MTSLHPGAAALAFAERVIFSHAGAGIPHVLPIRRTTIAGVAPDLVFDLGDACKIIKTADTLTRIGTDQKEAPICPAVGESQRRSTVAAAGARAPATPSRKPRARAFDAWTAMPAAARSPRCRRTCLLLVGTGCVSSPTQTLLGGGQEYRPGARLCQSLQNGVRPLSESGNRAGRRRTS